MLKQKSLWLLIVLIVASWGVYRLYTESDPVSPGDRQNVVSEERELEIVSEQGADHVGAELTLQYLGHAAFLLQVGDTRFLMDPYDPHCGYGKLELEADYVTVSHEHMDHNYIAAAPGAKPIRGLSPDGLGWEEVSITLGGVEIFTVPTYHDDAAGKLRGRNAVFVFDTGDIRLVHLGDLGHLLSPEQLEKLVPVDVLLIPAGGHYTIDASEAWKIIDEMQPKLVIPMHYRTEATRNWPIAPLADFLKEVDVEVKEQKDTAVTLKREVMPSEMEVWVMKIVKPVEK